MLNKPRCGAVVPSGLISRTSRTDETHVKAGTHQTVAEQKKLIQEVTQAWLLVFPSCLYKVMCKTLRWGGVAWLHLHMGPCVYSTAFTVYGGSRREASVERTNRESRGGSRPVVFTSVSLVGVAGGEEVDWQRGEGSHTLKGACLWWLMH